MRKTQSSPRLIVTTGAADGSSPSWCNPRCDPGAYRLTMAASRANPELNGSSTPYESTTARRPRSASARGSGFTGAPSVSSAVREYT
jgi:hypothetical protein